MNDPIGNLNILHKNFWNLVDIEKWMVFVLSFNQMNNDGNYYGHISSFLLIHKHTNALEHTHICLKQSTINSYDMCTCIQCVCVCTDAYSIHQNLPAFSLSVRIEQLILHQSIKIQLTVITMNKKKIG